MKLNNTKEMITFIIEHLIKQGVQAVDEYGECIYRSEDGLKCAVGCLITENNYSESFEHHLIQVKHPDTTTEETVSIVKALQKAVTASTGLTLTKIRLDYLDTLQRIHDSLGGYDFDEYLRGEVKDAVSLGKLPKYTLNLFS